MVGICRLVLPILAAACLFAEADDRVLEDARLDPNSFDANSAAGEYLLGKKRLAAAIPYLERAWRIDSTKQTNGYDLALSYLETGAAGKSRTVIEALLKLENRADLHNLLGDVEEAENHPNEAAREYESAARLDPSEKNLFDLGSELLKHHAYDPALKVFEFGAGRFPASPRIQVGIGTTRYSLGQYDQAVESLCRAVDLDPKDTKAIDFLGRMYDVAPRYASEVTKRLAHFTAVYPDNSAANYYYALSLRKRPASSQDAPELARPEKYLLRAVTLAPNLGDAHFQLGLLYEDETRNRQAIIQYKLAIRCDPNQVKPHYRLARLYARAGEKALAEHELQLVRALKEKEPAQEITVQ